MSIDGVIDLPWLKSEFHETRFSIVVGRLLFDVGSLSE
jgi:hypothetical protein